jgi:uncharacterized protein YbaP (TraB family)
LLAGVGLLACHSAAAQSDAPQEKLDEIIVTGERAGTGLWHVYKGAAQLWIFGTVSPLPKDMTWRSKQLEQSWMEQIKYWSPNHSKSALHARFAAQRAKFTKDADKWEKFRPIIAAAFLEEDALHGVGLSTRLDLADEVRSLARKHHVRIEEFKIAGLHDVLDALKTLPPATEQKCVAASLATIESGMPRLIDRAQAWATGDVQRIQSLPESEEVAACRASITVDPGGFLDTLRARGYTIDSP